jgi:2-polyprenyl-3-methyl-5-hydroxy-6-metoxy-1,4-benzoquinol methylase
METDTDSSKQQPLSDPAARLIAFYLPQYHPIPENDAWWGDGFTEWTNVRKARPVCPGHYQPHVPSDLGYYDLRSAETRQAQAQLAREYGINGFCYYHYWFNGKRLLDLPLNEVLASGQPDLPFCLCWANESWTRAWNSRDGEILIAQDYSPQDDLEHIKWLVPVLKDRRYIRIDNKPLLLIYRANKLPDPRATARLWRDYARQSGLGEIFLCRVESYPDEHTDPTAIGFDAAVEFQPDWTNLGSVRTNIPFGNHQIYEYPPFAERQIRKPEPPYRRYPCVIPSWDNSPRRQRNALIFSGSNPETYQKWLASSIAKTRSWPADERIVFINAWNEWGEGNHLEPDVKSGRGYLEATRRALENAATESSLPHPTDPSTPIHGAADRYYLNPRPELQKLIPLTAETILDIGCGSGALGAVLKARQACSVVGVELVPEAAESARSKLDRVHTGTIEQHLPQFEQGYFDCIIMADVLEHMVDPYTLLHELSVLLTPTGCAVISLPNVRHWSVVKDLLEGRFDYKNEGIMDRTHLRFFTMSSAVAMINGAGYDIDQIHAVVYPGHPFPADLDKTLVQYGINASTLAQESQIFQFLIIAKPRQSSHNADTAVA